MTDFLFDLPPVVGIPVVGEAAAYPVGRIFCVGRNYAAHAAEMGGEVDREAPWYFTKTPSAAVLSPAEVAFPPGTSNYHHEMELAFALGAPLFKAGRDEAMAAIYAYGAALDMTRRDLQQVGKDNRRPWDLGKDVENGAVLAPMVKTAEVGALGPQFIRLSVNGEVRQDAVLGDMVWAVDEIASHLSQYYHLRPGDVILTGTPAGVGAVQPGDVIEGEVEGLPPLRLVLGEAE